MFSQQIIDDFLILVVQVSANMPYSRFVDFMIGLRIAENTNLELINYGSYLIESRPGLGQLPLIIVSLSI